ncbi:RNA polymerase subunit sigma-70 [Myxococcus xanthus]|uniref:RNA polymerase sigma factor n=1 Tax=Myxococcus xanthus TaxID=34 RepID=UPI0011291459|nr:sigma-70 family RNA polymerase sigma factor [Myxococcus xanthus]QDE90341.1 RNA polymerase subunit sigma-70 [Myxococcus xanthus]
MNDMNQGAGAETDGVVRPLSDDVISSLVENHREFLRFLERRVGSRAVAEDILQDAFVRGMGKAETLREDESLTAWFYSVLRNAVIDHYRRRGTTERALASLASELEEGHAPEAELAQAVCQCVGRLAGTLKPEYAEALRRVEVEGVSVPVFAQEAGITSNNAAVRLHRARKALKKQLEVSCGTCASHGCLDCTCATPGAEKKAGGCGSAKA